MEQMTWKTKLIILGIFIALSCAFFGIVYAMSYGSLILAFFSLTAGGCLGWYAKYIYDKYFKVPVISE